MAEQKEVVPAKRTPVRVHEPSKGSFQAVPKPYGSDID
jgi:hypothetical protein